MKNKRSALLQSILALILCFAMLAGTTLAWFTDSVGSGRNEIAAGNLDVELEYKDAAGQWQSVTGASNIFREDALWEPGYTEVVYLRISNAGDLALNYRFGIHVAGETGSVNAAGVPFKLSDHIRFGVVESDTHVTYGSRDAARTALTQSYPLSESYTGGTQLYPVDNAEGYASEKYVALVVYMPETVNNAANHGYGQTPPEIKLGVQLVATQQSYESDRFGADYDANAVMPEFTFPVTNLSDSASAPVTVDADGKVAEEVILTGAQVTVRIPVGVQLNEGVTRLTMTVNTKDESESNVTLEQDEELVALDVHVDGISEDNTVPMIISLGQVLPIGLNEGNAALYHVEDGTTNPMTREAATEDLDTHNEYHYDPATGFVTVAMAGFSEVDAVADIVNAWNGTVATAFGGGSGTETDPYIVANADQLAYLGNVISNDNENFGKAYYKLISDVNMGGSAVTENGKLKFYPIGYTSEGYEGAFQGTFDGAGHTISNIYQNTWQLVGTYDGTYYNAAMGLFGYVNGGMVKNLTVDNFSSDGEFTPTGCVAAYACNSTFENIAITNCNPRVYNTGNGGIVGIGGNSDDPDDYKLTFTNITIDNTNKITALWGSWDVACGGLVGMFRGDGHVYMTNCHVAAQMDVYNDVCGNYQYYWYRYSGMLVGTNKNMTTDANGYTVPETNKFHAENCTVHFGDWNDYYYCELVANSLASYTHDHQFSRLTEIGSLDEIKSGDTWTKAGNFLLISGNTKTCYHIVDKGNGLTQHLHSDAGEETVDGKTVLKEDKQIVYLPFNQLFTGYGWGVKHIPVGEFDGVTILQRNEGNSIEKFAAKESLPTIVKDTAVTVGELFAAIDQKEVPIRTDTVMVSVTALNNSEITATYVANKDDWKQGTLTFDKTEGLCTVTIQDYYFCKPTTIVLLNGKIHSIEKFAIQFPNVDKYLYRVGNKNAISLSSLFAETGQAQVDDAKVEVTVAQGTGTYTPNVSEWEKGTLSFSGYTGLAKVVISEESAYEKTLWLEVVNATNVTSAKDAKTENIVLLNDVENAANMTVAGHTFYGNGFTLNYTGNGAYGGKDLKRGFVMIEAGGTLDNTRVVCKVFPEAHLYTTNLESGDPYQLSAVAMVADSKITNCYVKGARTNIWIGSANAVVDNTITESGSLANIHIDKSKSDYTVTLNNVTTIQYLVSDDFDQGKNILGSAVLVGTNESTSNPKIHLTGSFKQNNWVTAADKDSVTDTTARSIIGAALDAKKYIHVINGVDSANLGIIYLNTADAVVVNDTDLPYETSNISMTVSGVNITGKVCSLVNATDNQIANDGVNADKSTVNGYYEPQFSFDEDLGGQLVEVKDGSDEYCYVDGNAVKMMFKAGDTKTLNVKSLVNIEKYTQQDLQLVITCKDSMGNAVAITDDTITLSESGEYTLTYSVTDIVFFDEGGNTVEKTVNYSWNVPVIVSLKDVSVPNASFEFDASKQIMGYGKKSIFAGGNTQYLPFLAGMKIYDYNGQERYLRFDGDTDFNKIAKASTTDFTSTNHVLIEVELVDGGKINVDTTARAASGGSTYTGTIQTSGNTIYYVNDGTTSATTTTWVISSYKFVGNNGVEVNSGTVTFSGCVNGSVPTGSFDTSVTSTVTFNANGGQCAQTVGYATSVSATVTLPTPTRSGYIFAGWYTATTGGTKIGDAGAAYTPSEDITLYAQWGKPCTVTYDANGGSCDTASAYYNGTPLTLPNATRDGYWFLGWQTEPNGGEEVGKAGETYKPSGEITLYAKWQEQVEYTVTYNANGGTCATASATYQGTGLTLPTPTRTGYKVTGWYTAATGGTEVGDAGATYTPSANITLYAQWEKTPYIITVNTSNATVSGVTNGQTAYYGDPITFTVSYSGDSDQKTTVTDANGNTITTTGSYTFTMPASNVTINSSSSCVTPDTLITLADGTQVRVDSLTGGEELLVWNMETGKLDSAPIMFVDSDAEAEYEIVHLYFSDGTDVKVIYEHGFWDYDLNKYVYLDRNADQYIGHTFAKQNGNELTKVTLTDVVLETEMTTAWSPVTVGHLCYFVNGMLSMPGGVGGLFNIFDVDPETMTYDPEALQKDIETYGLFTYEELNAIEPLSREMFEAAGGAYLKVSMGKGNLTMDELKTMIRRYSEFF